jgi:cold shock CspA family protein
MTPTQGTVFSFDPDTGAGTVALDDGSIKPFSADAFAVSRLRLLRTGQRVRFEVDSTGSIQALTILTMGEP